MRRGVLGLLMFVVVGSSFGEVLYTDGRMDVRTCIPSGAIGSIDVPCEVSDLYFSDEIEADVKPTSPKSVVFGLKEKKKSGVITIACQDRSYSVVVVSGKDCDTKKVIVDKRDSVKVPSDNSVFSNEEMLNNARGLLKGMIRGESVRGYEVKPLNKITVINNDDYFKAYFDVVYVGSGLVGYRGKIKNLSKYIEKSIRLKDFMQKGYVLVYIEGQSDERVVFRPNEERQVFIVAMKSNTALPYTEGR